MAVHEKRTVRVLASFPIFPTEDCERILKGLSKLFPLLNFQNDCDADNNNTTATLYGGEGVLICNKSGKEWHGVLAAFRERLFVQRILDAFRKKLRSNKCGETTFALLNKQAALVGRINLVGENEVVPLGTLCLKLEGMDEADLEEFIDWLSPRTKKGVPVMENRRKQHNVYIEGPYSLV